jgi:hypothetical protein
MVSTGTSPARVVRSVGWDETDLVEGTEALLWAGGPREGTGPEELPGPDELPEPDLAVRAVLSWARPRVLRFETATPEPLPELLLVSTLAVSGPARFVVRKNYQVGNTAVCDPPERVHIVERRDLFRVAAATEVLVRAQAQEWKARSVDCSLGGMRLFVPCTLEVGQPVEVAPVLLRGEQVGIGSVVRHCQPYLAVPAPGIAASPRPTPPRPVGTQASQARPGAIVGLQFVSVSGETERLLTQFVGYHQRRLMPRVHAVTSLEYKSHGRAFVEAFGTDLSPGDLLYKAYEAHVPGERVDLRIRVGRKTFDFAAFVLSSEPGQEEEGVPRRHLVRVALQESSEAGEAQFRKAVRELAIERVAGGP